MKIVYCTCPKNYAERISEELLKLRLIACVNIIQDIKSKYWWEGKICDDFESLLIMKTDSSVIEELIEKIKSLHPYTVPEILVTTVDSGYKPYIDWVIAETSKPK